jgi:hypothetical protein
LGRRGVQSLPGGLLDDAIVDENTAYRPTTIRKKPTIGVNIEYYSILSRIINYLFE